MREAQKRQKSASGKAATPKAAATAAPPWERIFEVDFDALQRRSEPLSGELSDLLRLFDGTRTLRAVVDASDGGDGLRRFSALERDQLLTAAAKAAPVADEDDEELDAWLAEGAEPAASRAWLRWAIAPAALVVSIGAVALLRPAHPTATSGAATAMVAPASVNALAAAEAPTAIAAAEKPAAPAAVAAPAVEPAAVATAKPTEVAPAAAIAATPPAAAIATTAPAAAVATTATAKADVVAVAKDAPAAKVDAPAAKVDAKIATKVDAPVAKVDAKVATKVDAPAAKVDAPATLLASAPLKAAAKPEVKIVAPAAKPAAVEKGGATVAAKTSAPAVVAAPAVVDHAPGAADPARYQALLAEGKSRYGKGQFKLARAAYLAAMQLDPSRSDVLVPLARCQLDSGALDDAFTNARRAIAARGDEADAWLIVGAVEQQRAHAKEARVAYQKYLALAPNAAFAGDVRAVLRTLH